MKFYHVVIEQGELDGEADSRFFTIDILGKYPTFMKFGDSADNIEAKTKMRLFVTAYPDGNHGVENFLKKIFRNPWAAIEYLDLDMTGLSFQEQFNSTAALMKSDTIFNKFVDHLANSVWITIGMNIPFRESICKSNIAESLLPAMFEPDIQCFGEVEFFLKIVLQSLFGTGGIAEKPCRRVT